MSIYCRVLKRGVFFLPSLGLMFGLIVCGDDDFDRRGKIVIEKELGEVKE